MAIYHHTTRMIGRSNGGSPTKALAYISGIQLADNRTGEVWNFQNKPVEEVQILLPENAPVWAKEIQKLVLEDKEKALQILSNIANSVEKRGDAQVYREVEFSLPRELTYEQNKELATEYVQDQFCQRGMLAIQCFHTEKDKKTGELNPHCHTFFLTRELTEGDLSQDLSLDWNLSPGSFPGLSTKKNRDWNERELHGEWREQWAQYANFYLKLYGHDITLDHRSYQDQGLDIEPQVKLGKGVKEQERRAREKNELTDKVAGKGEEESLGRETLHSEKVADQVESLSSSSQGFMTSKPATDRMHSFRDVQLRNLYRILRKPEVVFDIVTRHYTTFMWGDVQKILGRYVDERELFQRLDSRLRNSKELLLLKPEGAKDHTGRSEDQAVYTTRSMLKAEKELVGTAESLAAHQTHGVSIASLEQGLGCMQAKLQEQGHSLSEGQEKAIRHVVDVGQLKCIVGYAGAGKTTALEACRDIWEAEGYRVYGLAPTGRAAQNLEGSGLSSQTLHKFLKSFEEGRCQYSDKSILVLDEAGMVDVGRFETFLGAVKTLGVKAVVVGDAAQLQPVEAGPAFRLVTTRVGASRLEEIVRQKEDWQREATVLFGRQESHKAIQAYQGRGHIHLVEEELPRLLGGGRDKPEDVVKQYEIAARTSGLIYREMMKDIQAKNPEKGNTYRDVPQHQDYSQFLHWRNHQRDAGKEILEEADVYKPLLEERRLDPLEIARLFVSKEQNKSSQYIEATDLLKSKGLDHLIGVERAPGQLVEVRSGAKATLIEDWKQTYQENPHKSLLMMAYSNRDVKDLNHYAREHLKASGHIGKEDMTYTITRETEDDFGRKKRFKEERAFSKGDRLVFTQNNSGLGVKNGSLGEVIVLSKNALEVKLDEGKTVSFSPNLFSFFDQGWAVTIHKSQGINVGKSFLLASHEMNQNLTYVAMTRHREGCQVYGSKCDFWREDKVGDILSKSGEKLGAVDYLDAHSLAHLMKEEDKFLNKLFTRLGDELHAMGVVSRKAFTTVVDRFLGRAEPSQGREAHLGEESLREIRVKPETIREEDRAQDILRKRLVSKASLEQEAHLHETRPKFEEAYLKEPREAHGGVVSRLWKSLEQHKERVNHTVQDVYEDWKHPAFKPADHYKRVFEEGLKVYGEEGAIQYWQSKREAFFTLYEKKLASVEKEIASPLLSYMSSESKNLAWKAAFEDPDKTLHFLGRVQTLKQAEQEERVRAEKALHEARQAKEKGLSLQTPQESTLSLKEQQKAETSYLRFKELRMELKKDPDDHEYRKEIKKISDYFTKDKAAFEHIKALDPKIEKDIVKVSQEKIRSYDRGYGGLSL